MEVRVSVRFADVSIARDAAALRRLDPGGARGHMAVMSAEFAAPAPEACRTMGEVREGVDEIDRLLVALLARRQGYMDAAARIKPNRDAVRDEARIAQVLANVRAHAEAQGLSWAIAEPVWRTLVERCIAHEFDVWDRTRT
ncbi:MAG: chorismate mutase [Hyphomonadaceae bacterium]|nr:chorismate mutase [Hyphomonadaceae bacterium]